MKHLRLASVPTAKPFSGGNGEAVGDHGKTIPRIMTDDVVDVNDNEDADDDADDDFDDADDDDDEDDGGDDDDDDVHHPQHRHDSRVTKTF